MYSSRLNIDLYLFMPQKAIGLFWGYGEKEYCGIAIYKWAPMIECPYSNV